MDILKVLKNFNLEGDQAEAIEAAIKKDIHTSFIPKAQYNKKVQELDAVRTEADDLKARSEAPNEYELKYNDISKELEALRGEYDGYKADIEKKATRNTIDNKIINMLKNDGFTNEKVVNLLLKNLDYDTISLNGEEVAGFDLSAFTKGYEEFRTVSNTEGTPAIKPPTNINNEPFTRERLKNMSTAEINANWEAISHSLQNIQ